MSARFFPFFPLPSPSLHLGGGLPEVVCPRLRVRPPREPPRVHRLGDLLLDVAAPRPRPRLLARPPRRARGLRDLLLDVVLPRPRPSLRPRCGHGLGDLLLNVLPRPRPCARERPRPPP